MWIGYKFRVFCLVSILVVILILLGCTSSTAPGEQVVNKSSTAIMVKNTPESSVLEITPTEIMDLVVTSTQTPEPPALPEKSATRTPAPSSTPGELPGYGPFRPFERVLNHPISTVKKLIKGPDGDLWVIGVEEVTSYDGENWLYHGEISGYPLGFDGLGRLWIVDEEGGWISAYDGTTWHTYGPEQGWLPAGWMFNVEMYASVSDGVVTDARGDTWLVTINDVRILHDDHWILLTPEDVGFEPSDFMLEYEYSYKLSDIAIDSSGDVWVTDCAWMGPGPAGEGARWYDGASWSGQSSPVVSSGCIKDVEIGEDGRIWTGVDDEIWRYTQGSGWELLPHPVQFPIEGMRWGWIIDLVLDGKDAFWVTMVPCGGASCDSGQSITFWVSEEEWLVTGENNGENGLPDIASGANDLTWGCFAHGLYQVSGGMFIPVDETLSSPCQIEADKTGRVWLSIDGEPTLWFFDAP